MHWPLQTMLGSGHAAGGASETQSASDGHAITRPAMWRVGPGGKVAILPLPFWDAHIEETNQRQPS